MSCLYRGSMPQPGDKLEIVGPPANPGQVKGVDKPVCGRIQSVGLSLARSAVLLNITAELYNFSLDGNLSRTIAGGTLIQ